MAVGKERFSSPVSCLPAVAVAWLPPSPRGWYRVSVEAVEVVPLPEASCEYVGQNPFYGLCDNQGTYTLCSRRCSLSLLPSLESDG